MRVKDAIHESIGPIVIFPRDEREDDIGKLLRERTNFLDKNLERRHAYAIFAVQLLHDQFGIQVTHEAIGMVLPGKIEPLDQGAVLSDIVRRNADDFGVLLENRSAERIFNNAGNGRLPRIPTRPPVGEEVESAADGDGLFFPFHGRRCAGLLHRFGYKALAFANERELFHELALQ